MNDSLTRREFTAAVLGGSLLSGTLRGAEPAASEAPSSAKKPDDAVAFFLVGDTHFCARQDDKAKLDERSAAVTSRLVERINELPGSDIPPAAGSGVVLAPRGLIHAGDCIDSGDKPDVQRQTTEWAAFAETFGLDGRDGRLKTPVYEVHGNHDGPRGDGLAVKKIAERNAQRPGVTNVSKNGQHYSWDWGDVHFVNLGIVVGQDPQTARKRRYAPLDSLEFLVSDLKERVGNSGRPIVCTHHIDVLRYSQPLPFPDEKAVGMEWDPADVHGFHQALAGYNVAAILYGHTHARNVFRWDGTAKPAATAGIPTFNVDNSSHYSGKQQAIFYFELRREELVCREYRTGDAWQTGEWTPQVWRVPLAVKVG
ncbi:MAG TPA: metallophosphoesterase [Pirellulales bacterium]